MRTNIDLDEELVREAFEHAPEVTTKKDLVHLALRELVKRRGRRDIRDLFGTVGIRPDYDHKKLRVGGAPDFGGSSSS